MTAFFMLAIGLASVFGNPVSGLIMQYLDASAGLHTWPLRQLWERQVGL